MARKPTCCFCGEIKEPEYQNSSSCRKCAVGKTAEWRRKNRARHQKNQRENYEKNKALVINRSKKWAAENRDARRRINFTWRWKLRLEIIEAYGGKCACCGENTPEFLSIDHIHNDGYEARKSGERSGASLYRQLKAQGFPKDKYQLLCMNCNFAKGHFGICPHQQGEEAHNEGINY